MTTDVTSSTRRVNTSQDEKSLLLTAQTPGSVTRGLFLEKPNILSEEKLFPTFENIQQLLDQLMFDAYAFTIMSQQTFTGTAANREEQEAAEDFLSNYAQDQMGLILRGTSAGASGYSQSLKLFRFMDDTDQAARLLIGSPTALMPNFEMMGAEGLADTLGRQLIEDTSFCRLLTRADVKVDISQAGLFDELLEASRAWAKGNKKMKPPHIVGSPEGGMSFYLGAVTSSLRIRVYQKGYQLFAIGKISEDEIDPDLVRIEFQFRPQSEFKAALSLLTPQQLVASRVMSRHFMELAFSLVRAGEEKGSKMNKIAPIKVERRSTLEDKFNHGIKQFGGTFARHAVMRAVEVTNDIKRKHGYDMEVTEDAVIHCLIEDLKQYLSVTGLVDTAMREFGVNIEDHSERSEHFRHLAAEKRRSKTRSRISGLTSLIRLYEKRAPHLVANLFEQINAASRGEAWLSNETFSGVPFEAYTNQQTYRAYKKGIM